MRRYLTLTVILSCIAAAQVQASLWGGSGGRLQPDVFARPGETTTLYVGIFDGQTPIPNLTFSLASWGVMPQEGGHGHLGGWGWGGFTTSSGTTGPNGEQAAFTYIAGPAAGIMWPTLEFDYQSSHYVLTTVNGLVMGVSFNDLPYIGNGNFVLIGATSAHPDNHYVTSGFSGLLHQLANDYNATWSLTLAYNDSVLRRGGIFDLNSNYAAPHNLHRFGTDVDVRANTAPNAIPQDAQIRAWFEERVRQLFGPSPLLESAGTDNEHYHIFGQ